MTMEPSAKRDIVIQLARSVAHLYAIAAATTAPYEWDAGERAAAERESVAAHKAELDSAQAEQQEFADAVDARLDAALAEAAALASLDSGLSQQITQKQAEIAAAWEARALTNDYDPRYLPATEKSGATIGMAMTELTEIPVSDVVSRSDKRTAVRCSKQ